MQMSLLDSFAVEAPLFVVDSSNDEVSALDATFYEGPVALDDVLTDVAPQSSQPVPTEHSATLSGDVSQLESLKA